MPPKGKVQLMLKKIECCESVGSDGKTALIALLDIGQNGENQC